MAQMNWTSAELLTPAEEHPTEIWTRPVSRPGTAVERVTAVPEVQPWAPEPVSWLLGREKLVSNQSRSSLYESRQRLGVG